MPRKSEKPQADAPSVVLFNATHADLLVTAKDGKSTVTIPAKARITIAASDLSSEMHAHRVKGHLLVEALPMNS